MSARLPLVIVGAVMMFVSLFFPTLYWYVHAELFGVSVDGSLYYWMYGFIYAIITVESEVGDYSYTSTYTDFTPDPLGTLCMMIIIAGGILALVLGTATEHKAAVVGGALGIAGMIIFYVGVLMALPITPTHEIVEEGYYPMPFAGFFICIVGGILALVGGLLEKY